MSGQRVGYVRVSTVDQSTVRQLDGIALDRVFEDKASGKVVHRYRLGGPGLRDGTQQLPEPTIPV